MQLLTNNLNVSAQTMRMLRCAAEAMGEDRSESTVHAFADTALREWLESKFPDIANVSDQFERQRRSDSKKHYAEAVASLKASRTGVDMREEMP